MRAVIDMTCDAPTALERIRTDAGGDRAGRADDDPDAVRKRLEIYRERTTPLVAFYRDLGVRILEVPVGAATAAAELWALLQDRRDADL